MKVNILILTGMAICAMGLQSFVTPSETKTKVTSIEVVAENWQSSETESESAAMAPWWYVSSCTTYQGIPGTTCSYVVANGNPVCSPPPKHTRHICRANM